MLEELLLWVKIANRTILSAQSNRDKYIDREGNGFSCVGHTEGLDEPGVIFSYTRYVRMLEANLPTLLGFFYSNIGCVG